MKLENDFYNCLSSARNNNGFERELQLVAEHEIFQGHFPGFPLTPGVIQLKMAEESIAWFLERPIKLEKVMSCKFYSMLNPEEHETLKISGDVEVVDDSIKAKVIGTADGVKVFHLKAKYRILNIS